MAQPLPHSSPFHKGLQELKNKIDKLVEQMEHKPNYLPDQGMLNAFSSEAVALIQQHHPSMPRNRQSLLMAVIDLSEVPIMHPSMQKVAVKTALKDASKNLQDYLNQRN